MVGENGIRLQCLVGTMLNKKFSEYFDVVIFQNKRFDEIFTARNIIDNNIKISTRFKRIAIYSTPNVLAYCVGFCSYHHIRNFLNFCILSKSKL